jgi:hypothetical protein
MKIDYKHSIPPAFFVIRTVHMVSGGDQGCGVGTQKLRLGLRLLTPRFLKLRRRLFHKSSIYINNGKPIRHFIATT